jgi:hypothetical protein
MMVPAALASRTPIVDVTGAMDDHPHERSLLLRTVPSAAADNDPFAGVTV